MTHDECPVEAARVAYENEILEKVASEIPAKSNSSEPSLTDSVSEIQSAEQTDNPLRKVVKT